MSNYVKRDPLSTNFDNNTCYLTVEKSEKKLQISIHLLTLVMGPGIPEPENSLPNPTFSNIL